MRKTTFVQPLSCGIYSLCLVILALASHTVFAQNAPALPSDPKALLLLAAKSNGLAAPDEQPWHLKATFSLIDATGSVTDQGTFEEFWAGPRKYKIAYESKAFTQTEYVTEKGIFRSGSKGVPPEAVTQAVSEFMNPVQLDEQWIEHAKLELQKKDQGGTILLCVSEKGYAVPKPPISLYGQTWCFTADSPALRISMHAGEISQFVHNNIGQFQDRYVPRDLLGAQGTRLALKAHLETVEALKPTDEAEFNPPPDATPAPVRVNISSGVAQALHLQQPDPEYPPIAKAAHVTGTVVLQAVIGADGHVLSLHVLSGPAMLFQAAQDSVKKWTYKPYLLNNEPAEVSTTINVVYPMWGPVHAAP
jgi:TonB family protein